jgi:hypothetical protein
VGPMAWSSTNALSFTGIYLCEFGRWSDTLTNSAKATGLFAYCTLCSCCYYVTMLLCLSGYMSICTPNCFQRSTLLYCFPYTQRQTGMLQYYMLRLHTVFKMLLEYTNTNYHTTKYSDLNKGITRRYMSCRM